MLEVDLRYLGQQILVARKNCNLTQKELATQTGLSVKTVQDIEKGIKNPTYDTLARLVARLGIPVDTLFHTDPIENNDILGHFICKFRTCNRKNQGILLAFVNFLVELLLREQYESKNSE